MIYKTGKVYRIICLPEPTIQYIGSTFNDLRFRWKAHKNSYKTIRHYNVAIYDYMDKYGIDNFKIVLIKEYQVVDRLHLHAYEQLYINRVKCVNKCNPFSIRCLQKINYYEKNKAKYSSKIKEYYEKNKDLIKAQRNQKYICNCGSVISIGKKSPHEKTKKHINFILTSKKE